MCSGSFPAGREDFPHGGSLRAVAGLALTIRKGDSEESMWEHEQASIFCKHDCVATLQDQQPVIYVIYASLPPLSTQYKNRDGGSAESPLLSHAGAQPVDLNPVGPA